MEYVTTFPHPQEAAKARQILDGLSQPYRLIEARPGHVSVGTEALVIGEEVRRALYTNGAPGFICSGWVEYRPARIQVPSAHPLHFEEDVIGRVSVMVLQPCDADLTKIRSVAQISGNLTEAFPYLNAVIREGFYSPGGPTLTFMDGYRMITLFPQRIAMAKTDEIVDTWRVLEMVRVRVNDCWAKRASITPCYDARKKPPALEIYYRLPKTNCRECGEKGCMAFALRLWTGHVKMRQCAPVFEGEYKHLREALVQICSGLGETEKS